MHLTIKLSENKFYHYNSCCKLENTLKMFMQLFCLSGLLNSLSNKEIEIKSFFFNILSRQLSFPTNIGHYINSHSNFNLVHPNIICEKFSSYFIFPLLEYTTICKASLKKRKIIQNQHTSSN